MSCNAISGEGPVTADSPETFTGAFPPVDSLRARLDVAFPWSPSLL